ncbi:MAG: hypothetical protein VB075_03250 [Petrimonas sp.]|nr:hypothetical protein [Petrimonas sp.]MEA5043583.1 hypothetical protein [Petrimonas sp.]
MALLTVVPRNVPGKGFIAPSDRLTKGIGCRLALLIAVCAQGGTLVSSSSRTPYVNRPVIT